MKVFFHVQHLLGIGHLRRADVLARALREAGFEVTLASGGMPVGALQLDCKAHSMGWQYNFSKRTFGFVQYARVTNENTASNCGSNTFNAAPFTIAGGQDPRGLSLGLSHVF